MPDAPISDASSCDASHDAADRALLQTAADSLRVLAMDAVQAANSGHPGMPMGTADIAASLWAHSLKFDPTVPDWLDRDRFILSAGHGSMLLYGLLYLTGYPGMDLDALRQFRQWGSLTPGHPEYGHTPGVEVTTGPLGQGLAHGVGMAMAECHLRNKFGAELVDHQTYVIASDGDLMEGISHEAASLAGRLKLDRLTVLWDDNGISIDGDVRLSENGDILGRFAAAGWAVTRVDGHDLAAIQAGLNWARAQNQPSLIACVTKIGKGSANKEGDAETHGKALGAAEITATKERLGFVDLPFAVPLAAQRAFAPAIARGQLARAQWQKRLDNSPRGREFLAQMDADVSFSARGILQNLIAKAVDERPSKASREYSGICLEALIPVLTQMIGGSADLTGSNNTRTKGAMAFDAPDYQGRYVHYGVREHAMAAAMNGMALHGGIIPFSGTFLVFADYCRPSIRLAALMGIRVIHVMTHDSIGLGEDGPTHQPIEHLASLRAMPNLHVFRPADLVETAEAWEIALSSTKTPSILALSRQKLPACRFDISSENLTARGAYELISGGEDPQVSIFASGGELGIATQAHDLLVQNGITCRVVSTPCWDLFFAQDKGYCSRLIGNAPVKVAIEAATSFGWEKFIGPDGIFVGLDHFGASAPAERLFQEFGLTPQHVVTLVLERLRGQAG